MERRLAIATPFVDARRLSGDELAKQIEAIEVRGSAGVGYGAASDQQLRRLRRRAVERMKSARPPAALAVRVCAEGQQNPHDVGVLARSDERRRVEVEDRVV